MPPRKWRSWRHHRLALAVGYFTLSYSKLEQAFIHEAYGLAVARLNAFTGINRGAESEAAYEAQSLRMGDFRKAKAWARQARKMSDDPSDLREIERIIERASRLSLARQAITHYFDFLGDQFDLLTPAYYLQAYQWIKAADWGNGFADQSKTLKKPIIVRFTYHDLKKLNSEVRDLEVFNQGRRFQTEEKGFYRSIRQKTG